MLTKDQINHAFSIFEHTSNTIQDDNNKLRFELGQLCRFILVNCQNKNFATTAFQKAKTILDRMS